MIKYKTAEKESSAEELIEKSRFIATIRPVSDRNEADAFFAEIKSRFKDATHNVPVLILGEKQDLQWASDDGEPSGTAGAPVLQMLVKEGVTNVAMVVTRYFGGIKLGTGGLVRAYTKTAGAALKNAGIFEVRDWKTLKIKIPYSALSKIEKNAVKLQYFIENSSFENEAVLTLRFESENEENIIKALNDFLFGNIKIIY